MTDPARPTLSTDTTDNAQSWAMFLSLAVIWGSSFMWITVALEDGLPPMTLVAWRALAACVLLVAVLLLRGGRLPFRWNLWKRMLVLGATNMVIPMALISWGQQFIPSGIASILNAMVPLFTIVLAAIALTDEHVTPAKLGGLGMGFFGVVVLASPNLGAAVADEDAAAAVAGMLAVAASGFFYAVASVYVRRRVTGMPIVEQPDGSTRAPLPVEIALGTTASALVMLAILAVALERPTGGLITVPTSMAGWVGVVWLGALGTAVAYLIFYRLIARWGATRTTLVTYVIPVVAIAMGFVFLGERLRPVELVGAALIIGGVVLVNGSRGQRPLFRRAPAEAAGATGGAARIAAVAEVEPAEVAGVEPAGAAAVDAGTAAADAGVVEAEPAVAAAVDVGAAVADAGVAATDAEIAATASGARDRD